MKKNIFITVLMLFGLSLFAGCAPMMHTWPDQERSAENKMILIQERIGDGLKTGALSLNQSQIFLSTLQSIRADYMELRDKIVYQEEWNNLHRRLDILEEDINRSLTRTTQMEDPRNGDTIATLQRRIDDGRISGRLPPAEEREFQARLDSIRREYIQITEGGRPTTHEERRDISRRLDSLAMDIDRFR